jgi:methylmalonyl-CoA/ethylmalonyl-CoA epimerase
MNIERELPTSVHFIKDMGPIFQVAYVEVDFERAVSSWAALGVGPFFAAQHVKVPYDYHGKKLEAELTLAFSYWGDMQIEIIQQHDDVPSVYREWMDGSQSGIHHVCILVDDIADIRGRCAGAGLRIDQQTSTASADIIYTRMPHGGSHFVEFAQYAPGTGALFEKIKNECASWDGTNPIRALGDFI